MCLGLRARNHGHVQVQDGAQLFRVVDWVDGGARKMQKCGLLSITTRWYVGSVDPEKSPEMDYFAATATDHHYGRIAMLWRSNSTELRRAVSKTGVLVITT